VSQKKKRQSRFPPYVLRISDPAQIDAIQSTQVASNRCQYAITKCLQSTRHDYPITRSLPVRFCVIRHAFSFGFDGPLIVGFPANLQIYFRDFLRGGNSASDMFAEQASITTQCNLGSLFRWMDQSWFRIRLPSPPQASFVCALLCSGFDGPVIVRFPVDQPTKSS
jgi:hypothetical protein